MDNDAGTADDRLRRRRYRICMVPRSVLEALRVWQHALPKRISRNRTYIVWHGDPSPPLHGLLSLLTDVAV